MTRQLEIISGNLPIGRATYSAGSFIFLDRSGAAIEDIIGLQSQGILGVKKSAFGALGAGLRMGMKLGPVGLVLGAVFAPAAIPVGLTAAAIGAGWGLIGGGTTSRLVLHVGLRDGRTFAALCEEDLPALLANDMDVAQRHAARREASIIDVTPHEAKTDRIEGPTSTLSQALTYTGEAAAKVGGKAGDLASGAIGFVRRKTGR